MGKTKFGTKIVFVFVILLGAGAVLYAKNCMEQIAAYAVSLTDSAAQLTKDSKRLLDFVETDVKSSYDSFESLADAYNQDSEFVDGLVSDFSATSEELLASMDGMMNAIEGVANAANEGASGTSDMADRIQNITLHCSEVAETTDKAGAAAQKLKADTEIFRV